MRSVQKVPNFITKKYFTYNLLVRVPFKVVSSPMLYAYPNGVSIFSNTPGMLINSFVKLFSFSGMVANLFPLSGFFSLGNRKKSHGPNQVSRMGREAQWSCFWPKTHEFWGMNEPARCGEKNHSPLLQSSGCFRLILSLKHSIIPSWLSCLYVGRYLWCIIPLALKITVNIALTFEQTHQAFWDGDVSSTHCKDCTFHFDVISINPWLIACYWFLARRFNPVQLDQTVPDRRIWCCFWCAVIRWNMNLAATRCILNFSVRIEKLQRSVASRLVWDATFFCKFPDSQTSICTNKIIHFLCVGVISWHW